MKMTKGKVICETHLHNVVYSRFWESRWLEAANFHLFVYEKYFWYFFLKYRFSFIKSLAETNAATLGHLAILFSFNNLMP